MFTRRALMGLGATGLLAACTTTPQPVTDIALEAEPARVPDIYGPLPNERFPIPGLRPSQVPDRRYWRQRVSDPTGEAPGTVVVDPNRFYLHLVEEGGTAMRYGIGVGRQGFEWAGDARIAYKRKWPTWTPPTEMIAREPELEKFSAANGGQPPGLDNALGARALYLFENGVDTLYRLHGTNVPTSIGKAVSSGCIRLINQDVIDLYERVEDGSRVIVRAGPPSSRSA